MARPIRFDNLNLDNTEYIAPDFIITPPEEPPIWVIDENGNGGGINNDWTMHPPALGLGDDYNIKTEETLEILPPLGGGNVGTLPVTSTGAIANGGNVLMTMAGAQNKPTQTGTNSAPVADLTAKIQTLAAEKPLLVFGAIGLGLYFLLKDKK